MPNASRNPYRKPYAGGSLTQQRPYGNRAYQATAEDEEEENNKVLDEQERCIRGKILSG